MAANEKITTMLMFTGRAEEAINLYVSLFKESGVDFIQRYGPDYPQGPEGQVVHARFRLKGELLMGMDSAVPQSFSFTPAMSLWVNCDDETEIDSAYAVLVDGGSVLMELGNYPFAKKYAWINDRFGVSWQLVLS
jgi:predicted 3-demethylubiquinone-9 3-methyltransferase (glyoxalase superfamily)